MSRSQRERVPGPADDPRIAAATWAQRISGGKLAPDEARAFNAWLLADPSHERYLRAAQAFDRELVHVAQTRAFARWMRPSPYERLASAIPRPGARAWLAVGAAAVAAIAAVILVVRPLLEVPRPEVVTMATAVAEIRDEALEDGSVVTLGGASSIRVAFTQTERRVVLIRGEAFFDVTSGSQRPFIVQTPDTLVRVLGTAFDVSINSASIDVAVADGRVEIIRPPGDGQALSTEDVKHVLTAGQQVTAPNRGRVEPVRSIRVEDVGAWRRGELAWADTPIKDIVADLNRYDEGGVVLKAPDVADSRYTLSVQTDDIDTALSLIATSLQLTVSTRVDGTRVLRSR